MYKVEKEFHGRTLSIETGTIAKQAGGAVMVRQGDTIVLVTACCGAKKEGDFLPLTVDYVEKTYAAGKIPGGFFKREGKLSERETLTSRLIDRPCRPLFPEGFSNEVQVVATVLSADEHNDPDILAVCGASAALTLSELPFEGPLAAVRVGRLNGKLLINPTREQIKSCDINMVVAGSRDAIVMVEGGAAEASEADVIDALFYAHSELQTLIAMQNELKSKAGKPAMEWEKKERDQALVTAVRKQAESKLKKALKNTEKLARRDAVAAVVDELIAALCDEKAEDYDEKCGQVKVAFEELQWELVRKMIAYDKVRLDGRDYTTVRPISIQTGFLPRVHGSAVFTRGETQAIVAVTLGTQQEAQRLDSLAGEEYKEFMLHYNFPPFSVGETKPMRGPGRREIGHGVLAERAVKQIMPKSEEFSYVVRIVSEITESNGSSSMASVCGSSLALMDAGVPVKSSVAGVAMGLVKQDEHFVVLTDILGDEDDLGDMDFKVCGTRKGVTALQMDIKIKGLDRAILEKAMAQAREGRLHILGEMDKAISATRPELSRYAPKVITLKIKTDKIRDVIGPGGKTIRSITESCGVKIDVEDDGTVRIFCVDPEKANEALKIVKSLTEEAEVGRIYTGVVTKITDFGAFVEILPGTSGLLHISQIADRRINQVSDVLSEGDQVTVKVLDVDRQGKIRLSRREALAELEARTAGN